MLSHHSLLDEKSNGSDEDSVSTALSISNCRRRLCDVIRPPGKIIDRHLKNRQFRSLAISNIEFCHASSRALQRNIIPNVANIRSARKARVRNSLIALDSPKNLRRRRRRALNVLFDLSIKQKNFCIEAVVIKEPEIDRYKVFGIDVLTGQRLESHFSTDEVMTILEGDMFVTSLEERTVWEVLLRKVSLGEVPAFTICRVLPPVDDIVSVPQMNHVVTDKLPHLNGFDPPDMINTVVNQSIDNSNDFAYSLHLNGSENFVEIKRETEEMNDELDDNEIISNETLKQDDVILLPQKIETCRSNQLNCHSSFSVTTQKLGDIITSTKRAKAHKSL